MADMPTDMETKTWVDKSAWGDGPWQDEPDRADWRDDETGLPCFTLRNRLGAWCGYVGVTPDHPYYGKGWEDDEVDDLHAHGGLTFFGPCFPKEELPAGVAEHEVICHVPREGESDDVFWFGFDCGHAFDLVPEMAVRDREYGLPPIEGFHNTYRDLGFVIEEVTHLAHQIAAAEVAGEHHA